MTTDARIAGAVTLLAAAFVAATLAGCSTDLEEHQEAWAATKKTCGTYHYAIYDSSFSGSSSTTTIEIAADQPTIRRYVATQGFVGEDMVTTAMWTETGTAVGTHTEGRPPRTMEQLYADCARDVLSQDRSKNDVTFQADARGVLQLCYYVARGCQDDCGTGMAISEFACGSLVPTPGGS